MNKQSFKRALAALSIVFVLVFSCFSVNVFAEETSSSAETTVTPADTTTAEVTESTTTDSTTTTASTTTASTTAATTTTGTSSGNSTAKKSYLDLIVTLSVVAVILIVALVYYVKNREKTHKFFRSFKGEFKKVSWISKTELRKNTVIVVVIVIISVIAIALLDFVFSKGILFLMNLLTK